MSKRHFTALDGLRGVAALTVAMYHIPRWAGGLFYPPSAYLAVDFFFLLSGFVVDYAYGSRLRAGWPLRAFAVARVVRLYPLIALGATIALAALVVGRIFLHTDRFKLVAAFPFALLAMPVPAFIDRQPFVLNSPAWSLFFELVANAAFGILLFRLSTRHLVIAAGGLSGLLALTILRFGTVASEDHAEGFTRTYIRIAFPFVMGMLLNRLAERKPMLPIPFWVASLILVVTFFLQPDEAHVWLVEAGCIFVLYPLLILGAQASAPSPFWARVARSGGFISYPLYITHWPTFQLLSIGFTLLGMAWSTPIAVACVLATSVAAGLADVRVRARLSFRVAQARGRALSTT